MVTSRTPALLLVTDRDRLPDPHSAMARLPRGSGVLLRGDGGAAWRGLATAVAAEARRLRLLVLVSGDWRLAARLHAGLHLPEAMARHGVLAPALGWRRRKRPVLTVACHSPAALNRAKRLGADAALLSPVFPTRSHPGASGLGPLRFARWTRAAGVAVIALGGIDARSVRRLRHSGAAGVAAVGALG